MKKDFAKKENKTLPGVNCAVKNCYFNSGRDSCLASFIQIDPSQAANNKETDCSTFSISEPVPGTFM